MPLTLFNTSG